MIHLYLHCGLPHFSALWPAPFLLNKSTRTMINGDQQNTDLDAPFVFWKLCGDEQQRQ
jgi:hypothetical protein